MPRAPGRKPSRAPTPTISKSILRLDADAFIEETEEGEDDVTDIIGDVDKEEEA